jgi:hypothetical protein
MVTEQLDSMIQMFLRYCKKARILLEEVTKHLLSICQLFQGNTLAFADRKAGFVLDFEGWLHNPLVDQELVYCTPLVGNTSYSAIGAAWGYLGYVNTLA